MERSVQMVFQNSSGKNVTINIPGIKDDTTAAEIKSVMELIIGKNVFGSAGGDLKTIMTANIIARDVQEMAVR